MLRHHFLPIVLSLSLQKILIVGGGRVALQKLKTLLKFNCAITVVAAETHYLIKKLAAKKKITLH